MAVLSTAINCRFGVLYAAAYVLVVFTAATRGVSLLLKLAIDRLLSVVSYSGTVGYLGSNTERDSCLLQVSKMCWQPIG